MFVGTSYEVIVVAKTFHLHKATMHSLLRKLSFVQLSSGQAGLFCRVFSTAHTVCHLHFYHTSSTQFVTVCHLQFYQTSPTQFVTYIFNHISSTQFVTYNFTTLHRHSLSPTFLPHFIYTVCHSLSPTILPHFTDTVCHLNFYHTSSTQFVTVCHLQFYHTSPTQFVTYIFTTLQWFCDDCVTPA